MVQIDWIEYPFLMYRLLIRFVFATGVILVIGCASYHAPRPSTALKYTIKKGETLAKIAERYRISLDTLINFNDLDDPDQLEIGQVIYLPSSARVRPVIAALQSDNKTPAASAKPLTRSHVQRVVGPLVWPVAAGQLSSRFGMRSGSFHEGLDIRAEEGTEVFAAHAGVVAYVGDEWQGYGNMIVLAGKGFCTVYAHNNRNLVNEGDTVEPGQQIATVGMTGTATGPHVHFEVRVDHHDGRKTAVDPLALKIKDINQILAKNNQAKRAL